MCHWVSVPVSSPWVLGFYIKLSRTVITGRREGVKKESNVIENHYKKTGKEIPTGTTSEIGIKRYSFCSTSTSPLLLIWYLNRTQKLYVLFCSDTTTKIIDTVKDIIFNQNVQYVWFIMGSLDFVTYTEEFTVWKIICYYSYDPSDFGWSKIITDSNWHFIIYLIQNSDPNL